MSEYLTFRLLEPRRWLLEGAKTGYYLLDGELEEALRLAIAALNAWRVAHAEERTKWYSRKSNKYRINGMVLSGPFLLQRTLFELALAREKLQEFKWQTAERRQSPRTFYIRYIKHLILEALSHVSFHMVVAMMQVLRTYDDEQAAAVYNALRPALPKTRGRRKKTPYVEEESFEVWRDKLFASLVRRFSDCGAFSVTDSGEEWKRRFEMVTDPVELAGLVREALDLFTPWGVEIGIQGKFDTGGPAPDAFRFEGERLIEELPYEFRRVATLINPGSFDKIIEGFGFESADSMLQLPQVSEAMRKPDDDSGSQGAFPGLNQEQVGDALEELAQLGHERKELRATSLTVEVDGARVVPVPIKSRPWLTRIARVSARLPPDARIIEVYASPRAGGRVLVSYLSLPSTDIEHGRRWRSRVQLEGGQSVLITLVPHLDAGGQLSGSTLKISYRERFAQDTLSVWLKGALTPGVMPVLARPQLAAGIMLLVLVPIGIYLYTSGNLNSVAELLPWRRSAPGQPPAPNQNDGQGQGNLAREEPRDERPEISRPTPTPTPADFTPSLTPQPSEQMARNRGGSIKSDTALRDGNLVIKGDREVQGSDYYGTQITYGNLLSESFVRPANPVKPIPAVEQTMSGGQTGAPLAVKTPNGVAVRERTPTLKWETKEPGNNFIVSVYIDDTTEGRFTPLMKDESVSGKEWTPSQPLERGRRYTWQVRHTAAGADEQSGHVAEGRFRVLTDEELKRVEAAEAITPRSHLVMGHVYGQAGMLHDAEAELVKLRDRNPKSKIVKRLLDAVRKQLGKTVASAQ